MCDTRNIDHVVDKACRDEFRCRGTNSRSSWPEVQGTEIVIIRGMIHRRIHSTSRDPVMAQPHKDQRSFHDDFLDYVPVWQKSLIRRSHTVVSVITNQNGGFVSRSVGKELPQQDT